jgi:hypothetical protein
MNVPFTPFQQFEELNQHLLNPPYTEPNVRLYRNGTSDNLNLIVTERNQLLHLGHLSPTSPQLRHLNEEMASYMKARGRADKIYKRFQTHIIPQGGRLKGGMPIVYQPEEVRFVNELEQIEGLILFVEFENGTEGERRTKLRKAREMFDRLLPNVDNLHLTIMERMRFDMAQQQLNNLDAEYGMEYGYDEKKEGSGFSMNSERETNNGNLRLRGGMVEDEDIPTDFPFYFQDLRDTLTNDFPNLSRQQQLDKWRNEIKPNYQFSFSSLEFETENVNDNTGLPLLVLTQAQQNLVKDVYQLFHRWKKILYPTRR